MKFRNTNPVCLKTIENAFRVLKEDHQSKSGTSLISEALEECFDNKFIVQVIPYTNEEPVFIMSVFPEVSTISKIVDIVTSGKSSYSAIQTLWEKNTSWTIEIDEFILGKIGVLSDRELTALLLHEIGHIIQSNAITTRIVTILQYEYAQTNMKSKLLLRDKLFRNILSLPVLNACVSDQKKTGLKEEIKADEYVKKMGYLKDLVLVMQKIERQSKLSSQTPEKAMSQTAKFSIQTIDNIRERRNQLVKNNIRTLQESVRSDYISKYLINMYGTWFVDRSSLDANMSNLDFAITESHKEDLINKLIDRKTLGYYQEFGIFGRKKLERIDPYEVDYIEVKIDAIRSDSDKMMLLSYLHNKMDTVQFYIDILNDPNESTRYKVPHSLAYLETVKKRLSLLREKILKKRVIPVNKNSIFIDYPEGYEG